MIKKIIQYISYDIWFKKEYEYKSPKIRWAVRQFKVVLFTAQGFGEHSLLVRSAALTFYTLMAIVPIAALAFGIAKGFGLENKLNEYLLTEYSQYAGALDQFIEFADSVLERTKGGLIASVGIVVLFWAVLKVFGNIENAFNNIWEVRKSRSITRKFSDYLAVIFVTPILWTISSSLRLQLQTQLLHLTEAPPIVNFLFDVGSLLMLWVMFAFIYKVMPNTKVRFRSAITAGIVAGTIFQIFQIIYLNLQSGISSYNAIYGSFAALPLFLIWLQTSWQIVLVGAELSFAYQNIQKFEYEKRASEMSYEYHKKALILVMQRIVQHFIKNEGAVTSEMMATELDMPLRIVRDVIFDLEKAGLAVAIYNDDEKVHYYMPAKDVHKLRISDVIKDVETSGKDALELEQNLEFSVISSITNRLDEAVADSKANILLVDINFDLEKHSDE